MLSYPYSLARLNYPANLCIGGDSSSTAKRREIRVAGAAVGKARSAFRSDPVAPGLSKQMVVAWVSLFKQGPPLDQ